MFSWINQVNTLSCFLIMIISKGIQIQKLSQVEASMWNRLSDQALSCLILYLISLAMDSLIQSYSNVMKEFLLEIMHILLPSSVPVSAMLGWDSISFNFYPDLNLTPTPTLVCVFMFTLPFFFLIFYYFIYPYPNLSLRVHVHIALHFFNTEHRQRLGLGLDYGWYWDEDWLKVRLNTGKVWGWG